MSLAWGMLAHQFEQYTARTELSTLDAELISYAALIFHLQAESIPLEFDQQAFVDLLESAWHAQPTDRYSLLPLVYLVALHRVVADEAPEMAAISRFFEDEGYVPDWDRDVLAQLLGGVMLRPPEELRQYFAQVPSAGGV